MKNDKSYKKTKNRNKDIQARLVASSAWQQLVTAVKKHDFLWLSLWRLPLMEMLAITVMMMAETTIVMSNPWEKLMLSDTRRSRSSKSASSWTTKWGWTTTSTTSEAVCLSSIGLSGAQGQNPKHWDEVSNQFVTLLYENVLRNDEHHVTSW